MKVAMLEFHALTPEAEAELTLDQIIEMLEDYKKRSGRDFTQTSGWGTTDYQGMTLRWDIWEEN